MKWWEVWISSSVHLCDDLQSNRANPSSSSIFPISVETSFELNESKPMLIRRRGSSTSVERRFESDSNFRRFHGVEILRWNSCHKYETTAKKIHKEDLNNGPSNRGTIWITENLLSGVRTICQKTYCYNFYSLFIRDTHL